MTEVFFSDIDPDNIYEKKHTDPKHCRRKKCARLWSFQGKAWWNHFQAEKREGKKIENTIVLNAVLTLFVCVEFNNSIKKGVQILKTCMSRRKFRIKIAENAVKLALKLGFSFKPNVYSVV